MSGLTDVSAFAGAWPFRRLSPTDPAGLKARLAAGGVTQAWLASAAGIFHADPMPANEDLAEAVAAANAEAFYVKVAVLDPSLPGWRADAARCLDQLGFRSFKLLPSYHCYSLDDPAANACAAFAAERKVPLCVQLRMEDERGHHPLVKVPGVDAKDARALAERHPAARILACGAYTKDLKALAGAENLWAEPSFAESGQALRDAVQAFGARRLCFASHSPLYVLEAETAKLAVDAQDVSPEDLAAIRSENAKALLKP
ncbi:MAG: amidohydrolase [Planctomycetes bacterium]|nr:amidohydrolase [Planctomycetota bacterium]